MPVRPLLILSLSLALAACGGAPADPASSAESADPKAATLAAAEEAAEDIDVLSFEIGDCLLDHEETMGGTEVSGSREVDCALPHRFEVYHLFDLPAGDYPSSEAMDAAVEAGCTGAFRPYVGIGYDESKYYFQTLTPTAEGWRDGDREVVCMLTLEDGSPIKGSLRGAGV
jgi:hypothetical protein